MAVPRYAFDVRRLSPIRLTDITPITPRHARIRADGLTELVTALWSSRRRLDRAEPHRVRPGRHAALRVRVVTAATWAATCSQARAGSGRQAVVHGMHVRRMEARYVVRRRHGLRIEERRQLVVL